MNACFCAIVTRSLANRCKRLKVELSQQRWPKNRAKEARGEVEEEGKTGRKNLEIVGRGKSRWTKTRRAGREDFPGRKPKSFFLRLLLRHYRLSINLLAWVSDWKGSERRGDKEKKWWERERVHACVGDNERDERKKKISFYPSSAIPTRDSFCPRDYSTRFVFAPHSLGS